MSDPVIKGVKRSPSRPAPRHNSQASSAKNRATTGRQATPQPLKKRSAADKAPARKATKTNSKSPATAASKNKSAKTTAKTAPARKPVKAQPKATKATQAKSKAPSRTTAKATLTAKSKAAPSKSKTTARKAAPVKPVKPVKKNASAPVKAAPVKPAQAKYKQPAYKQAAKSAPVRKHAAPPPPTPRQPTQDEAAALRAFERAHKEFVRGHFGEARGLFRALVDKHAGVSEVTARARTYLAIAESRLRAEPSLPRDADSLYDRGVIELNRGDYVAAQELFERALKREPAAAHIHYGLAAVRARLGSVDSALESLQKALELQPNLRIRAQHDLDLTSLRNDPEFERLVFAPRF